LFKLAVSTPTTVESSLTISPGGHSFGKTKVGHMRQATFTVRSHGKEANEVVLGGFTISGAGFSVDQTMTTCEQGQMLQSNQNCKIVVDFMPEVTTNETGTLTVSSNAKDVHPKGGAVTLKGR
jgi:hypothetical protein